MTSHLGAVGLEAESQEELTTWFKTMLQRAQLIGKRGSTEVVRSEDPSGARVTFELVRGAIEKFLPSYAGQCTTQLQAVRRVNTDVSEARVIDETGEQVTALTIELEERHLLDPLTDVATAHIVALGTDMTAFADAAAFSGSEVSRLGDPEEAGDPPAHYAEMGWEWPPRMAPESFMSTGVFAVGEGATADARLNGTIIESATRTNALTGQSFRVLRVRTAGFEVDVCLADIGPAVSPGMIVGGWAFMVGSLDAWSSTAKPSLWRRLIVRH